MPEQNGSNRKALCNSVSDTNLAVLKQLYDEGERKLTYVMELPLLSSWLLLLPSGPPENRHVKTNQNKVY